MMILRTTALAAALAAGVFSALSAQQAGVQRILGTAVFIEGGVQVIRSGEYLPDVDVGLKIYEFDSVETGDDGYIEIDMSVPAAGSTVKVLENTVFYFEGSPRKSSRPRTTFQLLRGSLKFKVGRLASNESFNVQTDTALMGVRGTEFGVDTSPDRSVLVTVSEGGVSARSGRRGLEARPGTAVLIDAQSEISSTPVAVEDIDLYRRFWRGLRLDALKINARLSIRRYAGRLDELVPRLEGAVNDLAAKRALLERWAAVADGDAPLPGIGAAIRDKRELSRAFLELRAVLPMAERVFQTLIGLEQAHRDGFAEGPFEGGDYPNAAAFYREFNRRKGRIGGNLSRARNMLRIYRAIDRASGAFTDSSGPSLADTLPSL